MVRPSSTPSGAQPVTTPAPAGTPFVSELRREQVEVELAPVLPMIPALPVYPVVPALRELRTDAWWALAAGGTASLAAAVFCRHRATAPEPYGGTYNGRYHTAGTFVASAFLVCTSSMLLSTAVLTLPVLRTHAHVKYRDDVRVFAVDTVRYSAAQRAYQEALRARTAMVDSVWAARKAAASGRANPTRSDTTRFDIPRVESARVESARPSLPRPPVS